MTAPEPDETPRARPSTPLWVKALGVGATIVIALLLITSFLGQQHGPGQHVAVADLSRPVLLAFVS